jgi:urea transport system substrate-binding protein
MPRPLILVVDDDPDLTDAVRDLLDTDGRYEVETANNGIEAFACVERRLPDAILLDMRMPVMSGWEFARLFRERYAHQTPIIVFTAAESAEQRALEIGAEGCLAKPFDIDDLFRILAEHTVGPRPQP